MDARRFAPATARNRDAILDVLGPRLARCQRVLELASGSGEHIVHFAAAFPEVSFVPSEPTAAGRASIAAWRAHAGLPNVAEPLDLTVEAPWPAEAPASCDGLLAINLIHIAPPEVLECLFERAAERVAPGGFVYLYGAYRVGGQHTAPSNETFDQWLKSLDPRFGVRDLEAVQRRAEQAGFAPAAPIAMPSNNFSLFFERP